MKSIEFTRLHQQDTPLIICNVWDVASAKSAENLGFSAIGTSSAAIASMLGYAAGEEVTFSELLFIVKRIAVSSELPLSVDLEGGFSDDPQVTAGYIKALVEVGVVGINIEDSKVNKINAERELINENIFASFLSAITSQLKEENVHVFINVRTDTFLLSVEDTISATIKRANLYQAAGVDGLFVPCIVQGEATETIVKSTALPMNVMCMPDLANFEILKALGVKRISMGNFLFEALQEELTTKLRNIVQESSFSSLFKVP